LFPGVVVLVGTSVEDEAPLAVTTLFELQVDFLCISEIPKWTFGMCGVPRQLSSESLSTVPP
jgi:hypothetical protein